MNKRVLLLLALLAIGLAGVFAYRMYSGKVPHAAGLEPDLTVTAPVLFKAFVDDEAAANATYTDKLVQVNGTVREITTDGDGRVSVLLDPGDALGAVVCEFAPGATHGCTIGDPATIKGFCVGYNLDVLLQRCATL